MSANLLRRAVDLRDGESKPALQAFAWFFFVMCGYSLLRPMREAAGIAGGVDRLSWMFTATFVTMLLAVPAWSAVVARVPRRMIAPGVYRFFLVQLLAFFVLSIRGVAPAIVARVFFVWISVFNLFVVSIFWSLMADLFRAEQGKRLFPFIAAGGTTGAIAGPALTAILVTRIGSAGLLLLAAVLLEAAVWCAFGLARREPPGPHARERIGGGVFAGFREVAKSPYLLAICAQTIGFSVTSTVLYFLQARIVEKAIVDHDARTQLFAAVDLAVNVLTLVLQTLVSGRVLSRKGVFAGLASVPLVSIAGFLAIAAAPLLAVAVGFTIVRRAAHFGFQKPAREVLFTVVPEEEKFKAKGLIDTVVYRGGDAGAGWGFDLLKTFGLGLPSIALVAAPLSLVGLLTVLYLARAQERLARAL